jgi:hypothetical protein
LRVLDRIFDLGGKHEKEVAEIMDAIAVVDPTPDMPVMAVHRRLTSRFRKKHGPRKGRLGAERGQ